MKPRWFVRGDIDGFFGLFIDNLLQLMLIAELCPLVGLPPELVSGRILPGAAFSILAGNLFYSWQARRLARKTGRDDVTALPYGINTVSLFAHIFLVIGPVYWETKDPQRAWQAGLFACLGSAVIEIVGAFAGDLLRRHTPRAALLSALAGIAVTFISMGFVLQIFAMPAVAIVPMVVILACYGGRVKLPLGLPAGLAAVLVGTALAWGLRALGRSPWDPAPAGAGWTFSLPVLATGEMLAFLGDPRAWSFLSVILPMGLFNVIGSLQNLESAEAGGDRFETKPSLLANGLGSLVAGLFGSPFPTTIYIGHPAWKSMGARIGYSAANGLVIMVLCLAGGVAPVLRVVPLEATIAILLWIGIVITAQAFQEVPKSHALAVALGLVPALAAWALTLVETTIRTAGAPYAETLAKFGKDLYIGGAIALSQGFLITSMLFSAVMVFVIERRFEKAAAWMAAGAVLSALGIIHAYAVGPASVLNRFGWMAAPGFAAAYGLGAVFLAGLHRMGYSERKTAL